MVDYEEDIKLAGERLSMRGKSGAETQKEQCAWPAYYGMKKAEINKLLSYIEMRVEAVRSDLYKTYNSVQAARVLPDRTIEKYIDGENAYLSIREMYLEVQELKDKMSAICDAFDRRGFALRDWTTLKVNQLQDDLI
jgi:hypothetical protein